MKIFLLNKDLGNNSHVTIKAFAEQGCVHEAWSQKVKEFKTLFPESYSSPFWIQEVEFQK